MTFTSKPILRRALIAGATAFGALSALPAQALQLASGDVLLAEVEDATGEGLSVKRLDN